MLDVTLTLLFFFIVATNIRSSTSSFDVTLPKATQAQSTEHQDQIPEVSVAKSGAMALNGEPMPMEELQKKLEAISAATPPEQKARVVLSADGAATVQQVMTAMDIIRKARITQVIQRVEPEK
ncbi:hypothetical protein BH09SUM1_BH09SUM1_20450 [soil metagenome]